MKRLTIFSRFSIFLLVVVCVGQWESMVAAQEFKENKVIDKMIDTSDERKNLLSGIGFTKTRILLIEGSEKRRQVSRFEVLASDIWRSTTNAEGGTAVSARNKDLDFSAGKSAESYELAKAHYDPKKHRFASRHESVFGMRLHEFMQMPNITFESAGRLPDQGGRRVEGVKFKWMDGDLEINGELHWLPDHFYVLTKCYGATYFPGKSDLYVFGDTEIEYSEHIGRIVPTRLTNTGGNSATVTEYSEYSSANPQKKFYTLEGLGLKTPPKPRWSIWRWLTIAAVVCLSAAAWTHVRKRGRFATP